MTFIFLETTDEQNISNSSNTISSSADIRQTNREKGIAEAYWQQVFNKEKEDKT